MKVEIRVNTYSSEHGRLTPGQQLEVDESVAEHWQANGIAMPLAEPLTEIPEEPSEEIAEEAPKSKRRR